MSPESAAAPRIRMGDIMLRRYLRLGESHTLAEVMGFLTDPHFSKDGLPFLVVIDSEGGLAGVLPPKAILAALIEGCPDDLPEDRLLQTAADRLSRTTGQVMQRNVPVLPPDAHLEDALARLEQTPSGLIGIVEEGRVVGLITPRILFEAASQLTVGALSGGVIPPHEPPSAPRGLRH